MPTYEYYCEECGFEFEKFQSMASEPVKICPRCGKESIKRKVSGGTGLIFKGSGFYITDYAHKNNSISSPVKDSKKEKKKETKKEEPKKEKKAEKIKA